MFRFFLSFSIIPEESKDFQDWFDKECIEQITRSGYFWKMDKYPDRESRDDLNQSLYVFSAKGESELASFVEEFLPALRQQTYETHRGKWYKLIKLNQLIVDHKWGERETIYQADPKPPSIL